MVNEGSAGPILGVVMRLFVVALSALVLAGCETTPEWASALRPTGTTAAPAAAPASQVIVVQTTPEQQLLDVERRLAANAQRDGLGAALAPALDPVDGFIIRPGIVYSGQDSVPAALGQAATGGPVFWQADRVFISQGGDMGLTSGRYVQVVQNAEAIQGRYLVVWRKDSAGEWRALTETRVPDPPPAPAARRRR